MKKIYILVLIMFVGISNSQAMTISVNPSHQVVNLHDTFNVDLLGLGFNLATLGGGVDLQFDSSILKVNSVSFASSNFDFKKEVKKIDNGTGKLESILVASILTAPQGDFNIASIEFEAIALGHSDLFISPSTFLAPWLAELDGSDLRPNYVSGSVDVSAVPLPAGVWFLISALGSLSLIKKRSSSRS